MRIGILTISTSLVQGGREADGSGDAIAEFVTAPPLNATIAERTAVADDRAAIRTMLAAWADGGTCDVILTTGGTGFAPSDFTPEATNDVIERAAPGLGEAMRAGTAIHTPLAWLSRGVSGLRGQTLIVNLPGRPKAVRECLAILVPLLPHALGIFTGQIQQHDPTP
jgi:molybdopterin adenylyltransferase